MEVIKKNEKERSDLTQQEEIQKNENNKRKCFRERRLIRKKN